jgi:hypothetical protein
VGSNPTPRTANTINKTLKTSSSHTQTIDLQKLKRTSFLILFTLELADLGYEETAKYIKLSILFTLRYLFELSYFTVFILNLKVYVLLSINSIVESSRIYPLMSIKPS